MLRLPAAALTCLALSLVSPASAAEPVLAPDFQALDYSEPQNWVCRPGGCRDDLSATILESDGSTDVEPFHAADHPLTDCFYVYPTVSHSPGILADPVVTQDERRAVIQQAERFTSVCRLFVPLYRQVTVTSMQRRVLRKPSREEVVEAARRAQSDVLAAWDHYLAHDNHGRGIILIGHSQGAGILISVIRQRIDGTAAQTLLVSAVLPGAAIFVPKGRETGGTFKAIPPCRADDQTGCVISFNMVRAERPIPPDAVLRSPGATQVCTNPAALAGGPGRLKPYLSVRGETIIPELSGPQPPWSRTAVRVSTPFVTTPDLYSAECGGDGAYLSVSVAAKPGDLRTGALTGDWLRDDGTPEPTMGLHLIDLNLAAGNLVEILGRQAKAYAKSHPPGGGTP